jgi:hypothetical protein
MSKTCVNILAAAVIFGAATMSATAQDSGADRTVDQYTCKDILRENGAPREVAVAFLHGYLLGKEGGAKFNIETLLKQTDAFIDHCLDNSKDKAIDAMMKAKK